MPDAHNSDPNLFVLHTLRCLGFTTITRVSEATGFSESDVESELIDLAMAGLVTNVPGDFGGWSLTDAGRTADAERIFEELEKAGARAAVTAAYDNFMVLNPELLDLCSAWQMRSVSGVNTLNDHTDRAYDSRVLDQLTDLNGRAKSVCADLSAAMTRFQRYHPRLADALTRAKAGALDYVADNTSSYHTVWFQLHEDLLVTLGIPRH